MNRNPYARIAGVAVGAATIFGLQQGLELPFYVALPLAIVAYVVTLLAMGYLLDAGAK